jgi:hypothetical protein
MVRFQTKNTNLGKDWRVLLHMEDVGIFYGHLVYFKNIWYILPFLVSCSKKNLATLKQTYKKLAHRPPPAVVGAQVGGGVRADGRAPRSEVVAEARQLLEPAEDHGSAAGRHGADKTSGSEASGDGAGDEREYRSGRHSM